ncbi:MAG: MBL fold metallo-hydrolase [Methanoregula sp.]|jgi:phosphoribosyl 1,2-cyclic phosphodiesterase
MRCTILASGSKGNCSYIDSPDGAILVDAGLSAKETLARMAAAGCNPDKIDAIIVTHEHVDHIRGLDVLSRKLEVPIFATEGTLGDFLSCRRTSAKPLRTTACRYEETFLVGSFAVTPFATSHDAAQPCGFVIKEDGARLGYCTDTGIISDHMLGLLKPCDGLVLESNHCPEMLANGPYPEPLKRRIRSNRGHLSNPAAAAVLRTLGKDVPSIILAHLSEINNTPDKAYGTARDGLGLFFEEKSLTVASQTGSCPKCPQQMLL